MKPSLLKRIFFALKPQNRLVIYDYPTTQQPSYTPHRPHKKLFEIIASNDDQYKKLLEGVAQYQSRIEEIKISSVETDASLPGWNNGYLPALDIILLYALLNQLKPKKYIEIGSGISTQTAFKVRKDQQLNFTITCIDPFPRKQVVALADEWYEKKLQQVDVSLFSSLEAGDIVFVDGTHTLLPGSDVSWFFLEVLPVLSPGVIVQVHDIYLPYDYPSDMRGRYYSEQYVLAAILVANPNKYEIIAPAFYISQQKELNKIIEKLWSHPNLKKAERHGGSFWFRIK
ncbi:MAG TPA: class I SAM-dependent methyltransferase [Chitinophagaceae bacterium]